MTGNFLHITDPAVVDFPAVCLLDRLRNRVIRIIFRIGGQLQKLFFFHIYGLDLAYRKRAFRQCAGLIKHDNFRMGQRLQIVTSLDKNADFGCSANTAKETKRNGDNQSAGTGNNKEGQRTVNPNAEWLPGNKGRKDGKGNRREYHNRGIVAGKTADEIFCFSFFVAGVFYKV